MEHMIDDDETDYSELPGPVTHLQRALGRLPERFRWTAHNLLAHPLSEVAYQVGLHKASEWIHDATVPAEAGLPRRSDA